MSGEEKLDQTPIDLGDGHVIPKFVWDSMNRPMRTWEVTIHITLEEDIDGASKEGEKLIQELLEEAGFYSIVSVQLANEEGNGRDT